MESKIDAVVVGSGYVGLTLALHMASRGLTIVAVDQDREKIEQLQSGNSTIGEKGVGELLQSCLADGTIRFESESPAESPAWIIAIPYFPGEPERFVNALTVVKGPPGKIPLVIIRGTVPIGFSGSRVLHKLGSLLGGELDEAFHLASCPERTLSGAAVEELAGLPQLIGGSVLSVESATNLFEKAGIACIPLPSLEGGELAKVFANYARLIQFNLTNFLGVLCHQFGLSDEEMYKSISAGYGRLNFLKSPGPGVGGFCLPKDSLVLYDGLKALQNEASSFKGLSQYPVQEYELNESIIGFHQTKVRHLMQNANSILAMGIAFKGLPKTDDIRGSVGLKIVRDLVESGKRVKIHDVSVDQSVIIENQLDLAPVPIELASYDGLLLLNNDPEYRKVVQASVRGTTRNEICLYDPWRLLVTGKDSIFQKFFALSGMRTHA